VRGDKDILKMSENFVLLRITQLRGVNIALFAYDYDQTWMSFFLDADARIYSRYGSRDNNSADSHNSPEGLLHTMEQVLRVHKEESAKPRPPYLLPPPVKPEELPIMKEIGYANTCIRCHMVHEAQIAQKAKDGKLQRGSLWLYPPMENIGVKLDLKEGNLVREVLPDSFAARTGVQTGDRLRSANGSRVLTIADLQFVLNGLESRSQLTLEADRAGQPLKAVLELDGDWRRSDVSWRKSIRLRAFHTSNLGRYLATIKGAEKTNLGIPDDDVAFRLMDSKGELLDAGLRKDDVIVAFDGKRRVPYRDARYYWFLEHQRGEKMEVTFLRGGKEQTTTIILP